VKYAWSLDGKHVSFEIHKALMVFTRQQAIDALQRGCDLMRVEDRSGYWWSEDGAVLIVRI
jgi:hypothetical protein